MRTLIAIANPDLRKLVISERAIAALTEVSEIDWVPVGESYTSEDLARDIPAYDACITSWRSPKFTQEVLEKAERLKFIGHAAGTVIPIVDESVFQKPVTIVNANSALSKSTAEGTVMMMMLAAWNCIPYIKSLQEGKWSQSSQEAVMGLSGTTVGLIGYGEISSEVIRLLAPYQMKILLHSRYCTEEAAAALGVQLCGLDELLQQSDIISLHSTLTSSSSGILGARELSMIRDGAVLINTARAPLIDEQALIDELRKGRFTAALDVFHQEPLGKDHELLRLSNVICTPHIAGFNRHWRSQQVEMVVQDLLRLLKGEPLHGEITLDKYRRLTPR
ncbi:Phosphoglycerate dehydrogenase [Paenibacillus sp. 1_12]|uniref:hydroxyacid dehydrogenase n=1 Tax=Paenibacillus sp. 1_12 TaxID=1566278 RepID=UPI0008E16BF2|nr:hydroxyacid dehydrogenase [Paenibacillus sp. 1_12]SFM50691.1 Phosphoglycerate dehydrogenase [Paenibacillus sp. 1_12]